MQKQVMKKRPHSQAAQGSEASSITTWPVGGWWGIHRGRMLWRRGNIMTAVAGEASQPSPCKTPGKIWLAVVHLGRGSRESGGELSINILGGNIKQSSHLRQGENLIEHSSQLLKRRNISGI
jgi:hypothetical protein